MWNSLFVISTVVCASVSTSRRHGGIPAMFGEQIDLVTTPGDATQRDRLPDWIGIGIGGENGPAEGSGGVPDPIDPVDSVERDREPLDEVERIEPRRWPGRSGGAGDVPPTRSVDPPSGRTTQAPLPPSPSPWRPSAGEPAVSAQRNPQRNPQRYPGTATGTAPTPTSSIDEAFCDFGPLPVQSLCEWRNGNGALEWSPGTGMGTNWVGGPAADSTSGTMEGGYAFVETSHVPPAFEAAPGPALAKPKSPGALLHSPQLGSTGVTGTCLTFKYAMDGLSVAGLRVLLHVGVDEYSARKDQPEESPLLENATVHSCHPSTVDGIGGGAEDRVLWHAHYYFLGAWQQAQILYTYPDLHSVIVEAVPVDAADPSRLYRGYVAIDDIDLQPGTSCVGFCNFAGGFCDWSNDGEDDFDWTISRGSGSPTTGPAMDSSSDRVTAGGYAYIDSGYPRRPGDIAKLVSTSFPATGPDGPMCMRFWFHMFGSGVGSLRLYLRHLRNLEENQQLQEIWGLAGNAGNAWFPSQVTVSSLDDFQLVFEASVGNTGMGDIAVDDITFGPGVCPVSPQIAGVALPRDCTFEVDECEWVNSRDPDRVDWERVSVQALGPRNQRRPYSSGHAANRRNEYFLGLARPRGGPRAASGGTAQLVSRDLDGSDEPLCVTFWYFMFEPFIDSTGPSLGVLRVAVQPVGEESTESRLIWQLYNNQGPTWSYGQAGITERRKFNVVFEGTWGPNRASGTIAIDDIAFYVGNCTVRPAGASVRPEDCSFEKGLCGWENVTTSTTSTGSDRPGLTWQRAFLAHRPAQLLDKTFGASGDFVFFDIFTTNQKSTKVELRSPIVGSSLDEENVCFTFWFAAFGVEESTTLRIIKVPADEEDTNDNGNANGNANAEENGNGENGRRETLWSLTAKGFNNPRPVWTPAQVTIDSRTPYRLVLEGTASNGGFAIDDIRFQASACATRPAAAHPTTKSRM